MTSPDGSGTAPDESNAHPPTGGHEPVMHPQGWGEPAFTQPGYRPAGGQAEGSSEQDSRFAPADAGAAPNPGAPNPVGPPSPSAPNPALGTPVPPAYGPGSSGPSSAAPGPVAPGTSGPGAPAQYGVPAQPAVPPQYGQAPQYGQYGAPQPGQYGPQYGQAPQNGPQYGQSQYGQPQYGAQYSGTPGFGQPPGAYRPMAAKPGIIPLRPLTLGEIFDGAFGAIRHNPAVMFGVSALVVALATVVGLLVSMALTNTINSILGMTDDAFDALGFSFAAAYSFSLGSTLILNVASPVASGILAASVGKSVVGHKAKLSEIWAETKSKVLPLLAFSVLYILGAVLLFGALIGIVVGLAQVSDGAAIFVGIFGGLAVVVTVMWLIIRLLFVPAALVLESGRLLPTVKRAWKLTRGNYWRILGIYLLATIAVAILTNLLTSPLQAISFFGSMAGPWVLVGATALAQIIASIITTVFISGIVALQYIDIRMRREALDVVLTAAATESQH